MAGRKSPPLLLVDGGEPLRPSGQRGTRLRGSRPGQCWLGGGHGPLADLTYAIWALSLLTGWPVGQCNKLVTPVVTFWA